MGPVPSEPVLPVEAGIADSTIQQSQRHQEPHATPSLHHPPDRLRDVVPGVVSHRGICENHNGLSTFIGNRSSVKYYTSYPVINNM